MMSRAAAVLIALLALTACGKNIDFTEEVQLASGFLATRFCGESLLSFSFEDYRPCGYSHVVHVYADGATLYFIEGIRGGERDLRPTSQQLRMLEDTTRSFGSSEMIVESPPPTVANGQPRNTQGEAESRADHSSARFYGSPHLVAAFKDSN